MVTVRVEHAPTASQKPDPEHIEQKGPAQKKVKLEPNLISEPSRQGRPHMEKMKPKKKLVTHVGRFQKVARNKHVKGYSATDLTAILGGGQGEQVRGALELHVKSRADVTSVHVTVFLSNKDKLSESMPSLFTYGCKVFTPG